MAATDKEVAISFREFLEGTPPGTFRDISELFGDSSYQANGVLMAPLQTPEIILHCDTECICEGDRLFKTSDSFMFGRNQHNFVFVTYTCKNCSNAQKIYALWINADQTLKSGTAFKFGEFPAFGPPTPARVISLIGPQRELFLKGRRAENQGMGIAAFAYYRRVIEDQKNRIFDEIIKVCNRLSAGQPIIDELLKAKGETQFNKAVDAVKLAIPQVLFINGHNPLTLLHSALSEGLHAQTDEECLEVATSIRVVMADLAERMGQALKDEAELSTAVSRLLNKRAGTAKAIAAESVSNPQSTTDT